MRTPKISKKSRFYIYRTHAQNAEAKGDYWLAAQSWWKAVFATNRKDELELGVKNAERCELLANLVGE